MDHGAVPTMPTNRRGVPYPKIPENRMKNRTTITLFIVFLVLCPGGNAPAGNEIPKASPPGGDGGGAAVARVNGVVITMESVTATMNILNADKGRAHATTQSMGETRKEALDRLIFQELAFQKAKSEGLVPGQSEVDEAVEAMARRVGGEAKLKEHLEKGRVTEDELRRQLERNLAIQRIFAREVRDKVSVSEEEVRKEYENGRERYTRPEKMLIADIVFFLEAGEESSRKKAEETLGKLRDDPEKNPSNLVSDGSFAVQDLEKKEIREKEVYDAAKKLEVGQVSDVFEVGGNFHIVKLKEYRPSKQHTFDEVKGGIKAQMIAKSRQKRLLEWEMELRKDARIEFMETGGGGK